MVSQEVILVNLSTKTVTSLVTKGDIMQYLILRNGWFFYDRRVPTLFTEYDNRDRVRLSLNTKCPKIAQKRMMAINDNIERYWDNLCKSKETHSRAKFKQLVKTAKEFGYAYVPAFKIPELPIEEIIGRLLTTNQFIQKEDMVKSIVGSNDSPKILLSEALDLYWDYSKPQIIDKNPNQIRKWKNPRKKAISNLIRLAGNIPINELTNKHLVKLRDYWLERMYKEGIRTSSANKDFVHIKSIIDTVSAHEEINIDINKLFRKIRIKEKKTKESERMPFTTEFIRNEILESNKLNLLDDEIRNMLYVSIETGARPIELLNLDGANDIILDDDIPYIHIRPRKGYSLKTVHSERKIPLIDNALEAFKKYPDGFQTYKERPDQFSDYINGFMSDNGLKPTSKHTYYSFRHSFQDRLTECDIPDRIQCQLMGHSFKSKGRTQYGSGASLEKLQKVIKKIQLT